MDDIKLPLKKGSLNDIEAAAPASSQDEAMEIDEPSQVGVDSEQWSNNNKSNGLFAVI